MVSRIAPDRYADTGYSVKDTAPEINAVIFRAMMERTPSERMMMGLEMSAAAREMVWASLPEGTEEERRAAFLRRFYGNELSEETIRAVAARGGTLHAAAPS
jgi:hypothetical protein